MIASLPMAAPLCQKRFQLHKREIPSKSYNQFTGTDSYLYCTLNAFSGATFVLLFSQSGQQKCIAKCDYAANDIR